MERDEIDRPLKSHLEARHRQSVGFAVLGVIDIKDQHHRLTPAAGFGEGGARRNNCPIAAVDDKDVPFVVSSLIPAPAWPANTAANKIPSIHRMSVPPLATLSLYRLAPGT